MLRRNVRKILKYVIIAALIFLSGALFFKSFNSIREFDKNRIETREKYSGLPKAPDLHKVMLHIILYFDLVRLFIMRILVNI